MIRQNQIIAVLFLFFLAGANSVFGSTRNIVSNRTEVLLSDTVIVPGSIQDSLVGVWELTSVDIPEVRTQIAAASSKAEKDKLLTQIKVAQDKLAGMTFTIKRDFLYSTSLHDKNKTGTWNVNSNRELQISITNNREKDTPETMSIVNVQHSKLVLKSNLGVQTVVVTYTRKQ